MLMFHLVVYNIWFPYMNKHMYETQMDLNSLNCFLESLARNWFENVTSVIY